MYATADQGHMARDIQSRPSYDPHLTHFVLFSTFPDPTRIENEDSINIQPFMMPGVVETLVDHTKDQNKGAKAQKIVLRL